MNPASRNVLAAVVTAAVALGVTAPVAAAAPKDRPGAVVQTGKPDKVAEKSDKAAEKAAEKADKAAEKVEKSAQKSGKTSVAGKDAPRAKGKSKAITTKVAKLKGKKADRRLARLQRRLTKDAVKKERFLKRLVASKKVRRLPEAQQTSVVSSNISADLSELADLKAAIAGGDDLRAIAAELRSLRPEVYNVILNQLRLAEKLRVELGTVEDPVTDQPADEEPADEPVSEEPAVEEPIATVTAEDGATDASPDITEEPADDDVTEDDPAEDAEDGEETEDGEDSEDAETPVADDVTLDAVVAKLLTFNARTPRAELRATQRALAQMKESLDDDEAEDADDADEAEDADEDADEVEDADEDADEVEDADETEDDTPVAGTPVISS